MNPRPSCASWLGQATSWASAYGILNYTGLLGVPLAGTVMGTLLTLGITVSVSAAIWEYIRHDNLGTIDNFVDSFHQHTLGLIHGSLPMIPFLVACCSGAH